MAEQSLSERDTTVIEFNDAIWQVDRYYLATIPLFYKTRKETMLNTIVEKQKSC